MKTKTKHLIGSALAPGIGMLYVVVVLPDGRIEVSANADGAVIDDEPVAATPVVVLDSLGSIGLGGLLISAARFADRADYP